MNKIIQARSYNPRQAALLQQPPSDIIEAAEGSLHPISPWPSKQSNLFYSENVTVDRIQGIINLAAPRTVHANAQTSGIRVSSLNLSRPTGALESLPEFAEFLTDGWTRWTEQAKEAFRNAASVERRPSTAAARLRVERLAKLQATLGFTTQDLATALKISRQQLYNWLDAANDIQLQESSRNRLFAVERVAKHWSSLTKAPLGSMSRELLSDGGSVFGYMSAEGINEVQLSAAIKELAAKLQDRPSSRSLRLREAGFTRRAKSLPADE